MKSWYPKTQRGWSQLLFKILARYSNDDLEVKFTALEVYFAGYKEWKNGLSKKKKISNPWSWLRRNAA